MFRLTLLPLVVLAGLMLASGLHAAGADDETAKLKQELKKREAELADAQKRLAQSLTDLAAAKQELAQALDSLTKVAKAAAAVKAEIKGLDE
jgi:septal ring factor EnvC (AmiA/AmiB activator)